jgi:hypothetical protein
MRSARAAELRNDKVWMKAAFGDANPAAHRHQRLADALDHGKLTNRRNESTLSRSRRVVPDFKS